MAPCLIVIPLMEVAAIVEALQEHLCSTHNNAYTVLGIVWDC